MNAQPRRFSETLENMEELIGEVFDILRSLESFPTVEILRTAYLLIPTLTDFESAQSFHPDLIKAIFADPRWPQYRALIIELTTQDGVTPASLFDEAERRLANQAE